MPMLETGCKNTHFYGTKNKNIFLYLSTVYKPIPDFFNKINDKIGKKSFSD